MITNPKSSPENEACKNWLASLAYNGVEVVIPEIADYEVRRELLRAGKERGCHCGSHRRVFTSTQTDQGSDASRRILSMTHILTRVETSTVLRFASLSIMRLAAEGIRMFNCFVFG